MRELAVVCGLSLLAVPVSTAEAEDKPGTWQGSESSDEAPQSRIEEELDPSIIVFDGRDAELRLGGLLQIHAAPIVGKDASIDAGDPTAHEGFLTRRGAVGVEGEFGRLFSFHLGVDLLPDDDSGGNLGDARLGIRTSDWSSLYVGSSRVPFARGAIQSSRHLPTVERPLTIDTITPERRLGATFEAVPLNGLGIIIGLMNGTEGVVRGNELGGSVWAMRAEYALIDERDMEVSAGVGLIRGNGPEIDTRGLAADIGILLSKELEFRVEGLCDRREPDDPDLPPATLPKEVSRCGIYNTVVYNLVDGLSAAIQFEVFDDNRDSRDEGDSVLLSSGFNMQLIPRYLRAQIHYIKRAERYGPKRKNDSLILVLQGAF